MAVTLPLGGLGTGTIAFSGDGGLRQWQPLSNHLIKKRIRLSSVNNLITTINKFRCNST